MSLFPCKGYVPLLVFLCDENQALTSARFLENMFWKNQCLHGRQLFILEKKILLFGKQKTRSLWWNKTLHFGKRSLHGLRYSLFQELGEHHPIRRHFGFIFVSFTERNGYHHKEICIFYLAFPFSALSYGFYAFRWLIGCLVGENIALFALIYADCPAFTMVILSY